MESLRIVQNNQGLGGRREEEGGGEETVENREECVLSNTCGNFFIGYN